MLKDTGLSRFGFDQALLSRTVGPNHAFGTRRPEITYDRARANYLRLRTIYLRGDRNLLLGPTAAGVWGVSFFIWSLSCSSDDAG